jgi:hypothetical protein
MVGSTGCSRSTASRCRCARPSRSCIHKISRGNHAECHGRIHSTSRERWRSRPGSEHAARCSPE